MLNFFICNFLYKICFQFILLYFDSFATMTTEQISLPTYITGQRFVTQVMNINGPRVREGGHIPPLKKKSFQRVNGARV